MKKIILIVLMISLLVIQIAFADWQRPQLQYSNTFHFDIREDDKYFYGQNLTAIFSYRDTNDKDLIKISPFFEIRRNTDRDLWERKEIGVELGTELMKGIYFGQTLQETRYKEDFEYYQQIREENCLEAVSKFHLQYPLIENDKITLVGFILDEYTYSFDDEESIRNEINIGLGVPLLDWLETSINWCHIDRINHFDSDTFELSATLIF